MVAVPVGTWDRRVENQLRAARPAGAVPTGGGRAPGWPGRLLVPSACTVCGVLCGVGAAVLDGADQAPSQRLTSWREGWPVSKQIETLSKGVRREQGGGVDIGDCPGGRRAFPRRKELGAGVASQAEGTARAKAQRWEVASLAVGQQTGQWGCGTGEGAVMRQAGAL